MPDRYMDLRKCVRFEDEVDDDFAGACRVRFAADSSMLNKANEHSNVSRHVRCASESSPDDKENDLNRKSQDDEDLHRVTASFTATVLENSKKTDIGHAMSQDAESAEAAHERAVDAGEVHKTTNCNDLTRKGVNVEAQDAARAEDLYKKVADEGNVRSMTDLADLFRKGAKGVPKNAVRAKKLYKRAVHAGDTRAMTNFAILLSTGGEGVAKDIARAKDLYERAADAGNVPAMRNLADLLRKSGNGVENDVVRAKELYEKAVEAGDVQAMTNFAILLHEGGNGEARDVVRAKELYIKAADAGNVHAMRNVADLLRKGANGVAKDPRLAKEFYEKAVDAGDSRAMTNFAILLYEGGEGVAQDVLRAKQLYEKAADAGNVHAMCNLADLLRQGENGVTKDVVRAKEFYEKAVVAGDVRAMNNLADLLYKGSEEVAKNRERAKQLLEKAAAAGNVKAMITLSSFQTTKVRSVANSDGSRDVFVKPIALNDGNAMNREVGAISRGIVVPSYDEKAIELHKAVQRESPVFRSVIRARHFTVGDKNTRRDATNASRCYAEAVELARDSSQKALALTEYARFLLELDEQATFKSKTVESQKLAIQCLEDSLRLCPFYSTWYELISLYVYCPVMDLRNPQRAQELKRMTLKYSDPYFKEDMVSYFEVGGDRDRRLVSLLRDAVVKPRSCLLLILGAPGRGKSTTLNSLRGFRFVSEYKSTELAEISQFVMEPGLHGSDDNMLRDLDFRENSFRAIASRLQQEDVVKCENNLLWDTRHPGVVIDKHRDVVEILRGAVTRSEIGYKNSQFVRCWDMGGQNEYEMTHSLFIARADILMFVVNLKRVCNSETSKDEVNKLCYWMQLAHMMVKDASKVRVLVVGTHKSEVESEKDPIGLLVRKVRIGLSESVDQSWVRNRGEKQGCVFLGIENSIAIEDRVGSGMEELSNALKCCAKEILAEREEIPLKWLALVDKMRRIQGDKKVLWTKKEVETLCEGFPGFSAEGYLRNEELIRGLRKMTTLTGIASTVLFELGEYEWVVSVSPERLLGMFRSVISRLNWERCVEKKALEKLDQSGTMYEVTLMREIWGNKYDETEKRAMIRLLCDCDLLLRLRDNDGVERESHTLYGVPYLLKSTNQFSKKKGENERMIEIVTKFHDSLPRGLQGGLMANLSRTLHQGLQHVDMVGTSSVRLVLGEGRVIVEYKAEEREIVWTSLGRNPLDLVDKCLKQMDEFLRHSAHPLHVRRRTVFRYEHCNSGDDVEVDHSALRRPDHEVRCKVCMIPILLSKFWEGPLNKQSKPSSSIKQDGNEGTLDFRFVYADVLRETWARRDAVISYFGQEALDEACKGLSRRLELNDDDDVENFGKQLRNGARSACDRRYTTTWEEKEFCFAISYTQHNQNEGRFKFSKEQWENLKAVLEEIRRRGVSSCRIWLDQCLWLRDPHQGCWAVSGLFPYLLWPVISLGNRSWRSDRTSATYERMWPFVEEVLGLWSLGVITASAERGARKEDGCRKWMFRNHRQRLEPEESMRILLLNIYHGGAEGLRTGWTEDVRELEDIARWNLEFGTDKLVVRSDWRQVIASRAVSKPFVSALTHMALRRGNGGEFLDASRRINRNGKWNGLTEWKSGNGSGVIESREQRDSLMSKLAKINVETDIGKFVLLGFEASEDRALWLLVALSLDVHSCNVTEVYWTKVVHGESSRELRKNSNDEVVRWVLREQVGKRISEVHLVREN